MTILAYVSEVLTAAYFLASAVSHFAPNTKLGKQCAVYALALKFTVQRKEPVE
jgi:hypothetical protein